MLEIFKLKRIFFYLKGLNSLRIKVESNGVVTIFYYILGVAYGGKYREASIRTEIRIPPKLAAYYYEVTIVNAGQDK